MTKNDYKKVCYLIDKFEKEHYTYSNSAIEALKEDIRVLLLDLTKEEEEELQKELQKEVEKEENE